MADGSVNRVLPIGALIGVTAVWGVTFVQVQDALELYPLFAFLAVVNAAIGAYLGATGQLF